MKMPKSCVHWSDPWVIAVAITAVGYIFRSRGVMELAILLPMTVAVLMYGIELARAPWRGTPRPEQSFRDISRNAAVRYAGLLAGVAFMLFLWWLLQEYRKPYLKSLFDMLPVYLPVLMAVAAVCILYTEWRLGPAKCAGEQYLALFRRRGEVDWSVIRDDLIIWAMKGFFLAMNFPGLVKELNYLKNLHFDWGTATWVETQSYIMRLLFTGLIIAVLPGFIFASRLFGTEIKAISRSWFGWIVTLANYPPFWLAVGGLFHWRERSNVEPWTVTLADMPVFLYAVGGAILLCELIHYWGEAILSIRSSALSNRGIITNGPFRFCKHPIYMIKCVAWFLIWLPFLDGESFSDGLRTTLGFFCFCGIYMMRALAEEMLLAKDPVYVEYALWMDQHGIFSGLGRIIPALSFRWRLERWGH